MFCRSINILDFGTLFVDYDIKKKKKLHEACLMIAFAVVSEIISYWWKGDVRDTSLTFIYFYFFTTGKQIPQRGIKLWTSFVGDASGLKLIIFVSFSVILIGENINNLNWI